MQNKIGEYAMENSFCSSKCEINMSLKIHTIEVRNNFVLC